MTSWEVKDLEKWEERIREKVAEFGLDCHPQEFEVCDHQQMLGYMAYQGMPSHYPHWSYGKSYEKLKTLYDHGVSGLPYEMVINASPSLAYLMRDNTLCLQILTIAHVYGHNDFFKNNFTFRSTRAEFTLSTFKAHAARVRSYVEDPSIGLDRVEPVLDAAHGLSLECRRNLAVRKLSVEEDRERLLDAARPREDPFHKLHRREAYQEPDLRKVPPSPEEDLLLFIRDFNPFLAEWEKDLLTIVHEESQYFIPQIETKIMNEGWASYWHREILNSLELPQDLHLEFLVRHNQVVRPIEGGLNPYHLGLKIWEDIRRRFDEVPSDDPPGGGSPQPQGLRMLFEARAADRDASFLRRFLTEDLIREMDLFQYQAKGNDLVISDVADDQGWRKIKDLLLKNVGMASVPVIKVEDAGYGNTQALYLKHDHDGRDLHLEYAEKTLSFAHRLWGRDVVLETVVGGKRALLVYNDRGFSTKALKS
ncbi:MAG: stage sporulation protein [Candidatus Binatota bacterium]|nr:stage sporulation protein [Candidatus Binatota bacterium]